MGKDSTISGGNLFFGCGVAEGSAAVAVVTGPDGSVWLQVSPLSASAKVFVDVCEITGPAGVEESSC